MTHGTVTQDLVPRCKGRKIETNFDGGDITSDAGVLLLRQLDRELGLTRSIARKIIDPRSPSHCRQQAQTMIRQCVYGLALGYEDLNDHRSLSTVHGEQLLVSYLPPAFVDAAQHAWAILALLVKRLRAEWPQVQIIFRGDSGF